MSRKVAKSGRYNTRSKHALDTNFIDKNGFWADEEECGECHRAKDFHGPGGFSHEFVPTGRKAFGV